MLNSQNGLVISSDGRVFIAAKGIGCGRGYDYNPCLKMTGLSKSLGDSTPFYCPDPVRSGQYIEVATIQGEEGRWTFTLTGPKPFGVESSLHQILRRRGCEINIQVHFGRCVDPTQFNQFTHSIIAEGVRVSDYSTDDLVALNPGEAAVVTETISLNARNVYEAYRLSMFQSGSALLTDNLALSVAYCAGSGGTNCGDDCDNCIDDCESYFVLAVPHNTNINGNPVSILFTQNGGVTWGEYQVPCAAVLTSVLESYEIACAGNRVMIVLNELGGHGHVFSVPISNIVSDLPSGSSYLALGWTAHDNFYYQGLLWVAGETGHLSVIDVDSMIVTDIEDGTNFPGDWYAISGRDNDYTLIGGADGQLAYRRKGSALQSVAITINGTVVVENITAVSMKTNTDWYVGTDAGSLYCTADCGRTWVKSSTLCGCVKSVQFPTDNIGYIAAGYPAAVYRSSDGGTSWQILEDAEGQIPEGAVLYDLSACPSNPNHFVAVGRVTTQGTGQCNATGGISFAGDSGLLLVGQA